MTQLRYVITRPCLLEGSLTIAKYLRPLFPPELAGQALHLRDDQGRDYSVRMTISGNSLIGMGSVYHALNLHVNDVLLIERVGNGDYLVQGVTKPYSRPQAGETYGSRLAELPHRRVVVAATPHVREVRLEQDYASYAASNYLDSHYPMAAPNPEGAATTTEPFQAGNYPAGSTGSYNDPLPESARPPAAPVSFMARPAESYPRPEASYDNNYEIADTELPTYSGAEGLNGQDLAGSLGNHPGAVRVDSLRLEGGHLEAPTTAGPVASPIPEAHPFETSRVEVRRVEAARPELTPDAPESVTLNQARPSKIEAVRPGGRIDVRLDGKKPPLQSRSSSGIGRSEAQRLAARRSEMLPATRITEVRSDVRPLTREEVLRAETSRLNLDRLDPQSLSSAASTPRANQRRGAPETARPEILGTPRVEPVRVSLENPLPDAATDPIDPSTLYPEQAEDRPTARLADVLLRGTAAAPGTPASPETIRAESAGTRVDNLRVTELSTATPSSFNGARITERPSAPLDTIGTQLEELAQLTGYRLDYLGGQDNGPARLLADLGPYSYQVILALNESEMHHPAFAQASGPHTYRALLTWEVENVSGVPRFTREALTALLEHARLAPLTPVDLRGYWNTPSFDLNSVASVAELVSAYLAQRGTFTYVLSTLAQQSAHSVVDPQQLAEKLGSGVNSAELSTVLNTLSRPPFMALLPLPGGQYYLRAEVSTLLSELSSYAAGVGRRLQGRGNAKPPRH